MKMTILPASHPRLQNATADSASAMTTFSHVRPSNRLWRLMASGSNSLAARISNRRPAGPCRRLYHQRDHGGQVTSVRTCGIVTQFHLLSWLLSRTRLRSSRDRSRGSVVGLPTSLRRLARRSSSMVPRLRLRARRPNSCRPTATRRRSCRATSRTRPSAATSCNLRSSGMAASTSSSTTPPAPRAARSRTPRSSSGTG